MTGDRLPGDGLIVIGPGNRFAGNLVAGATGCGDGCGISLQAGRDNVIAGNHVTLPAADATCRRRLLPIVYA